MTKAKPSLHSREVWILMMIMTMKKMAIDPNDVNLFLANMRTEMFKMVDHHYFRDLFRDSMTFSLF